VDVVYKVNEESVNIADEIVNRKVDHHQHAARPRAFFDDRTVRRAA
jgi:hypothetical protein